MIENLLRGHDSFRKNYVGEEGEFLARLASQGQSPGALYIGCSDSRVIPELLTTSSPGELFVVRNVANLVPAFEHADASVGAAIEYAVAHLHVPHIIVCGHYGCGGVGAMLDDGVAVAELPSLVEWLAELKPAVARARAALPGAPREPTWRRAVEENVIEQLGNLTSFAPVATAAAAGAVKLHGWVYDLSDGNLRVYDLDTDRFRSVDELLAASLLANSK